MKFVFFSRSRKLSASRRDPLGPRYDKKYLVFGEKMEDGMYEASVMYSLVYLGTLLRFKFLVLCFHM